MSEVELVAFGVAADADNARQSFVDVKRPELYERTVPVTDGAYDARMGTADSNYVCLTCGLERLTCPGHFGSMKANAVLPGPTYVAEIRRWLKAVCLNCGHIVVDLDRAASFAPRTRFEKISQATSDKFPLCPRCRTIHPKIVKAEDDNFSFVAEVPAQGGARTVPLAPADILAAFQRVAMADVLALGRPEASHPARLLYTVVAVPPNTIRPPLSVGFGAGAGRSHHDLTNLLQNLIKRNSVVVAGGPPSDANREDLARRLDNFCQIYYDFLMGSAAASATQGSQGKRAIMVGSRAPDSIARRWPRKQGRLRRYQLGKRVIFINRATISGNPFLQINQVGFPIPFARTVQVEETVQQHNIARLQVYFLNGRARYPGCTQVIRHDTGYAHKVGGLRERPLEIGDVVMRDIISGDPAYFNRQPSLERSSISEMEIVVLTDPTIHTLQMNVVACSYYNADFDGDQMNLWVPHTVMSRVEARNMSAVANWFIATKNTRTMNGQVQDSCAGSLALTRAATRVDKRHAMQMFSLVEGADFSAGGRDTVYTGIELASKVLEKTPVNYTGRPAWFSDVYAPFVHYVPEETLTVVKRGVLERGVLDKKSVGEGAGGGLYHLIGREYGPSAALTSIFELQQVAIAYLDARGFSVGLQDMVVREDQLPAIAEITAGLLREADQVTGRLLAGRLVPPLGMSVRQYYEKLQIAALLPPDDLMRPVLRSIAPDTNCLFQMVASGSKGGNPNLLHIMALIGQITINGQRISEGFGLGRTGPYFPRFATEPGAFGFVANNYIGGMTVTEYLWSNVNGRFDLINKALSTASTGYQNRKAIVTMQSAIVDNLRRLAINEWVVQFLINENGADTRYTEPVKFAFASMGDAALADAFGLSADALGAVQGSADERARLARAVAAQVAAVAADRDAFQAAYVDLEESDFGSSFSETLQVPVNVGRIVEDVRLRTWAARGDGGAPAPPSAKSLLAMDARVAEFVASLPYVFVNGIQEARRAPVPEPLVAAVRLTAMLVRTELCARRLLDRRLGPRELTAALDAIRVHYDKSLMDPGTCAGILAAQSVSEPQTQYMLDSHHRSVAGGTDKSAVVRPAEIFGAKGPKDEQSPEMFLRVVPELENDRAAVAQIANQIELMIFRDFIAGWALLYESFDAPGEVPQFADDKAWVAEFARNHPLLRPPSNLTNWCVRFVLDRSRLILKSLSLETVVERLRALHKRSAFVIHTPENASEVVVRVYLTSGAFTRQARELDLAQAFVEGTLMASTLRGVDGITSAYVAEGVTRHRRMPDGSLKTVEGTYAIRTAGSNISGVLAVEGIDPLRVVSSSVGDTERVFGICASRGRIASEIARFLGGKAPNTAHMLLYADVMTRLGRVTSLEKGGLTARERNNILLRMALADPVTPIRDAAIHGTSCKVYGISAPLILGTTPQIGTTYNEFVVDEDYCREHLPPVDDLLDAI